MSRILKRMQYLWEAGWQHTPEGWEHESFRDKDYYTLSEAYFLQESIDHEEEDDE